MRRWLVTGGCGFAGTNAVDALLAAGTDVAVLDNLSRRGARDNLAYLRSRHGEGWRLVEADVRDAEGVAALVGQVRPDVVMHLAGQVAMTASLEHPSDDFDINARGTLNVLEAVRLHAPEAIVLYSSSNKVYGSLEHLRYEETATRYLLADYPSGLDEHHPLDGHTPYGCSKLAADQYVRDYWRVYGVPTVVLRHSSMYGGRQFATYDQGWIGWFCLKALEAGDSGAEPFTVSGSGKQVRDVLHADDATRAYLTAVEGIDRAAGQVYNVGGGVENSLSLLELLRALEELTGYELAFSATAPRVGDQKVFVADTGKIGAELGWRPLVSKEAGLRRMLDWSRSIREAAARA